MKFQATLFFQKARIWIAVGLACLGFAWYAQSVQYTSSDWFNSPDEMATAAFAQQFANTGTLAIPQHTSVPTAVQEYVFPRSTYPSEGTILPVGSWGIPVIYGFLIKIFGDGVLRYATPLFTACASLALFVLLLWDTRSQLAAYLGQWLFLIFPAVWYYSVRGLFPQMLMLDALIIGIFFFVRSVRCEPQTMQRWASLAISFCFFGGAALIRPADWLFFVVLFLGMLFVTRSVWKRKEYVLMAFIGGCTVLAYIVGNAAFLESAHAGYIASGSVAFSAWWEYLLPFGIHPRVMMRVVQQYVWGFAPVYLVGGVLYAVEYVRSKRIIQDSWERMSFFVGGLSIAVLFLIYGNYLDGRIGWGTIGIAYVRYLLPMYVVFIAWSMRLLTRWYHCGAAHTRSMFVAGVCVVAFLLTGTSSLLVLDGMDGIQASTTNIARGERMRAEIKDRIPSYSIIATQTEDKFFWPQYPVIKNHAVPVIQQVIVQLAYDDQPIYWYGPVDGMHPDLSQALLEANLVSDFVWSDETHVLYALRAQ